MALAAGCQGSSATAADERAEHASVRSVEVSVHGTVVARVTPGQPCKAMVDGAELTVAGPPLTARIGDVQWTADDRADGTMLVRDAAPVARIRSTAASLSLFSPDGVALFRATLGADVARVIGRDGAVARAAKRTATGIRVDDQVVTGTDDLLLAALLTASEAGPDVRALAACHRLFTIGKVL